MKRQVFCFLIVLLATIPVYATIRNVPSQYQTIQEGINASIDGDTVLVAPGGYEESIRFYGKSILVKSSGGPDSTFIFYNSGASIISFIDNEPIEATLEGFAVQFSQGNPAVRLDHASGTLRGNVFEANNNSGDGGAVNAIFGDVLNIIDNVFKNNTSSYTGGAVRSYAIKLVVHENKFYNNNAGTDAGAIHLRASNDSEVHHNIFYQNHCNNVAGAIVFSECGGGSFYNNTVVANSNDHGAYGAGVVVWMSSNIAIYNNIVTSNLGKGLYSYSSNSCLATYNDVWNNQQDYDGLIPGPGSISADPMFVGGDPYSFELAEDSPCIDTGDPASPLDPDSTIADMGAGIPYASGPPPVPGTKHVPADYSTIGGAILYSVSGDTILVAPGTYPEHFSISGKAIHIISENGPETTILEANGEQPIIRIIGVGDSSHFATLEGFTVRSSLNASAVSIDHFSAILRGNIFENNHNRGDGGVVNSIFGEFLRLYENIFRNNSATATGGAVRTYGVKLVAVGNTFIDNDAGTDAGAIHLRANDFSEVHHNLFALNHCHDVAGAIVFSECGGGLFYNNTVVGNFTSTESHGGGVVVWMSHDIEIYNNIIANNGNLGLYSYDSYNCSANYNDLYNNDYAGITPGPGSISLEPQIYNTDTYELECCSPCIDAGNPASSGDPDNTIADMGFLYRAYLQGDVNCTNDINGIDAVYMVNYLKGLGNSPCPILSGDVNGNCHTDGVDVTYFINYLKGIGPSIVRGNCSAL